MYIYPDNLKAAPTLWLWRLRDLAAGGLLAVLGVAALAPVRDAVLCRHRRPLPVPHHSHRRCLYFGLHPKGRRLFYREAPVLPLGLPVSFGGE